MPVYTIYVWSYSRKTQLVEEHDSLEGAVAEVERFRPKWREVRVYEHRGRKRVLVYRAVREDVAVCVREYREAGYSLVEVSRICSVPLSTINEILKDLR